MKRYIYSSLLSLVCLFLSCCSDDFSGSGPAKQTPAILSFGFYIDDNPGLPRDYVVTVADKSPNLISLALPALIGRDNLTARFTTEEGNRVLFEDKELTSGMSPLDYSLPIDLYVTDGKQYTRYEVNVTKESDIRWKELPACTDHTLYSQARLGIDPISQTPYIAFKSRKNAEGIEDTYVYVAHYSPADELWTDLGHSAHTAYSSYLGFAVTSTGVPYVAYGNYDVKPYATCVEKVAEEGDWTMVGENLENAQCTYLGFAALADNRLITSMVANSSRTNMTSVYNGSTWNVANGPSGFSETYKVTMAQSGDKAYIAAMDRSTYNIKIYEYSEGGWSEIEGFQEKCTNSPTVVGVFKLTCDAEGNVYMLSVDNQTGNYMVKLRKFDVKARQWSTVSGNPTPILASDRHLYACAAIAPDGTPFIAYSDMQSPGTYLKAIYLDAETRQWSDPILISDKKVGDDISFVFTASGTGYLSFGDGSSRIHVYCTE